jgi:putative ABC transport system permease protein
MINSDFKIAVRNIIRTKVQTAISILGLGIGLGCIIVLMALIVHETSFDRFIPNHRNVYKIIFGQSGYVQYPLAETMKNEFSEVKDFFRFSQINYIQLRNKQNEVVRDQFFGFADPSLFKILGIKLIAGMPANSPTEVAISEKTAFRYFGKTSPLGAILQFKFYDDFINLTVSGVFTDFPPNSTLYPEFIANLKLSENPSTRYEQSLGVYGDNMDKSFNWDKFGFFSYVVLDKNADKEALTRKINKYRDLIKDPKARESKYYLQPVSQIYLGSGGFSQGVPIFRTANSNELKYYWSISFLILLISVTNYIFLTRAATSGRLRELGTRKVLGASRNVLRKQILLESNLITVLSLIPAIFVIDSGMTFINNTLNRTLTSDVFSNPVMWLLLAAVVIFTGTISGLIIGNKISRVSPLLLLTGKTSEINRSRSWDYSFLIIHFSLYIILVVIVISVTKQIKYSLTNIKGINPENVLIGELNTKALKASFTTICDEMRKNPDVLKVAGSSFIPPLNYNLPITLATPEGEKVRFDGLIMGEGMTELLDIEVIDGTSFGPYRQTPIEVLFNESSARKYNIKAGDIYLGFHVKGIVKDFHSHSLHTLIQPMVILQQDPSRVGLLAIKTDGKNNYAVIKKLRELYHEISPDESFEVQYLTDQINDFYGDDKNQGKIIGAFSILATVLSAMGLFGVALIRITKRTKEVGLRKVSGASIPEVLYLLNKDFVGWVLMASVIAVPASYFLISAWQDRFAYKTALSWWIFVLACFSAIIIAILTVSWQSWRAATSNPVEALRYE